MSDDTPPGTNDVDGHVTAFERLNSWKEIANYLGKGVRTVQRWESQMGLPVRRLGREGGEIVYALRSEIDAWLLSGGRKPEGESPAESTRPAAETSPPAAGPSSLVTPTHPIPSVDPPTSAPASALPRVVEVPPPTRLRDSRPHWRWALPAAIVLCGMAMTEAQRMLPGAAASARGPVGAVCSVGALRAWDTDGKTLWSTPLGTLCDPRLDTRIAVDPVRAQTRIAVQDLDGDGSAEVLAVVPSPSGSGDSLRVFNADGSPRFSHVPGRAVTYGHEAFRGFNAYSITLIHESDRVSLWLTASNAPWFPTVLQQISPSGEVLSEYWHNGHIMLVRPVTLRGRPFLLVGGYNNERRGGSLALIDRSQANGTAPAENTEFFCLDCAIGTPEEFIVFPNADITHEATSGEGSASVVDAILTGKGDLVVSVHQLWATVPGEAQALDATINYTLSVDDLALRHVEISGSYRSIHKSFERVGRLDHPIGRAEAEELSSVVRWDGARFVPLARTQDDGSAAKEPKTTPRRAGS